LIDSQNMYLFNVYSTTPLKDDGTWTYLLHKWT
jgi:hypothetical protein